MKSLFIFINLFTGVLFIPDGNTQGADSASLFQKHATAEKMPEKGQNVRIIFYNVENLYDPFDDSLKHDEEFTPASARHWTYSRFRAKLNHLAKTLIATGGWEPPAVIALCEAENRFVLNQLIFQTPLKKHGYKPVHRDSPDARGIDVAILYRPEAFALLSSNFFSLRFTDDTVARTRDILMVKGIIHGSDTVILFVNHWPSRRGGYAGSQPRRNDAAMLLRSKVDSIISADYEPMIIITGDFNDEPDKESLSGILKAMPLAVKAGPKDLVNLMYTEKIRWDEGTIKFQGQWSVFDQFIVTGNLVRCNDKEGILHAEAGIFRAPFLTRLDERNLGDQLKRTYAGPRYLGGFSDHLPVVLELYKIVK